MEPMHRRNVLSGLSYVMMSGAGLALMPSAAEAVFLRVEPLGAPDDKPGGAVVEQAQAVVVAPRRRRRRVCWWRRGRRVCAWR